MGRTLAKVNGIGAEIMTLAFISEIKNTKLLVLMIGLRDLFYRES